MIRKKSKLLATLILLLSISIFSGTFVSAAPGPILEVGEVRTLGDQAKVPIILHDTTYLTSAYFEFTIPADADGVSIDSIEVSPYFESGYYNTKPVRVSENKATIDIYSTGEQQRLPKEPLIVGYITFDLTDDFEPGQSVPIEISDKMAKERNDRNLELTPINGEISRRMTIGDVVGKNEVTAAGAMRVLQHVNGTDLITNREEQVSADVNADGRITQEDALQILDYVSGKQLSFFSVEAKELTNAVKGSEYSEQVNAVYGREPYTFKMKGNPSGLKIDPATGIISGTSKTTAKDYTVTIEATDAIGRKAERQFTLSLIDSNIKSVEKIAPIYVKKGETPNLPSKVSVTYTDKTTGFENVTWDAVDTSVLGTTVARGKVGDTGYTVTVGIEVIDVNYIKDIKVGYVELLNVHTIVIDASNEVYAVTVNNIPAHYEGNNQFSLASSKFKANSVVKLCLYDKYGNELMTKDHILVVN